MNNAFKRSDTFRYTNWYVKYKWKQFSKIAKNI